MTKYGHPRFYDLTSAEEELHSRKNKDYAGGGRPLGNFERGAAIMKLYPGFPFDSPYGVAMLFMLKQLDAALWLMATGREGEVEGISERLGDISIYAKLARILYEEDRERDVYVDTQVSAKPAPVHTCAGPEDNSPQEKPPYEGLDFDLQYDGKLGVFLSPTLRRFIYVGDADPSGWERSRVFRSRGGRLVVELVSNDFPDQNGGP